MERAFVDFSRHTPCSKLLSLLLHVGARSGTNFISVVYFGTKKRGEKGTMEGEKGGERTCCATSGKFKFEFTQNLPQTF